MRERILKCIEESGVEVCQDGTLADLNSLKFISILVSLEDEFKVEFPDVYLNHKTIESIDSIYNILTHVLAVDL